jgi:putative ABC transport system substrate-binding protein
MRRRTFLAIVCSAAASARPAQAQPQPRSRPYRIGFLGLQPGQSSLFLSQQPGEFSLAQRVLSEALRDLGSVEGQNITMEWRFTPDREKLPALAAELVALNPDAIVTGGGPAVRAAMQATKTTPIVMAYSGDPVGTGLVSSLSRPGGNLTGSSFMSPDLSAKRIEVLAEALPGVRRLATLWNPEDPVYAL